MFRSTSSHSQISLFTNRFDILIRKRSLKGLISSTVIKHFWVLSLILHMIFKMLLFIALFAKVENKQTKQTNFYSLCPVPTMSCHVYVSVSILLYPKCIFRCSGFTNTVLRS